MVGAILRRDEADAIDLVKLVMCTCMGKKWGEEKDRQSLWASNMYENGIRKNARKKNSNAYFIKSIYVCKICVLY